MAVVSPGGIGVVRTGHVGVLHPRGPRVGTAVNWNGLARELRRAHDSEIIGKTEPLFTRRERV